MVQHHVHCAEMLEIRSHAYNHKIVRFNSRSGNNSLNQSTINKDPPEEKSNESTVYNQYWSTNDLLSFECGSNDNEKWHHSNETEYHRANLDDRLGVNFNSGIFDWSQSESWLIVQNAIINTILCKPNLDISEAVRNMSSTMIASHYCRASSSLYLVLLSLDSNSKVCFRFFT
ncbi:unnamed protein product [Schistosoma mattheei]|uniref:Uncharacterized protein n=1 Tax=Schistosoma mattheei TaxID=31246 RepID=A0A183PGN6_9TREM|nr:unnamed protein product [Schistosoma mattheei]